MTPRPRPFTNLKAYDVKLRLLGDFAIIHARVTYTTVEGVDRDARCTDDYQRRDGRWTCIAANAAARGV
jgi:hypothetical protein